jgi:phosphoadenosine phosphosulfate reductase
MTAAPTPILQGARNPLDSNVLDEIRSGQLEKLDAEEILIWALGNFHPKMSLSCSFGNPEGLALLHMLTRLEPGARVYMLDTGRLPQETHDLVDRVRDRYGVEVEVVFPEAEPVQKMVREHGQNLFYESLEKRKLCCQLRKVEPNRRYLAELDAHVTGLRREQNVTRTDVPKVELEANGLVKVNPLVDWSREDVMKYVRDNGVPVNRLHQRGYPTVGCAPCTRAIEPGEDIRAGRWWWENPEDKECGLHVGEEQGGSGI